MFAAKHRSGLCSGIRNTLVSEIQTSCCTQLTSVALKVPGPLWPTFPDNIRSFLLGNIGTWIILFCLSLQYKTMSAVKQTSVVWDYFTEKGDWVTCTKCPKSYKLSTAKSSTNPLRYHLKTNHSVDFNNVEKSTPFP